jgi:hypothetical protein
VLLTQTWRIATIVALLGIVVLARRIYRVHANPVAIAVWPWLLFLIAQQIVAPDFFFTWPAAALIVASLSFLLAGAAVATNFRVRRPIQPLAVRFKPRTRQYWSTFVGWALVATVAIDAAIYYYFAGVQKIGVTSKGISTYDLMDAVLSSSYAPLQRVAFACMYFSMALLALECLALRRPTIKTFVFLGVVFAKGFIISNKAPSLLICSIAIFSLLIVLAAKTATIRVRALLTTSLLAAIAVVFYSMASAMRVGSEDADMGEYTLVGALGSPSVLAQYLELNTDWYLGTFEGRSIQGLLDMLENGLAGQRTSWAYNTEVLVSASRARRSNLNTGLYVCCHDIGIAGCMLVMFTLGIISTRLFFRFRRTRSMWMFALLLDCYILLAWLAESLQTCYNYWFFLAPMVFLVGSPFFEFVPVNTVAGSLTRSVLPRRAGAFSPTVERVPSCT